MTQPATLEVEALGKSFGGLQVFRDVGFKLAPCDRLGVIGPNGAGKTTLINLLCGKLAPTAGRILLDGHPVGGLPLHHLARRGVVRSFQQTNNFKGCTVRENLARAIRFSGAPAATWAQLDPLLGQFYLAARLDDRSDELPYGLQKMLGLLLAYATRPRVLLLDEPAAGLERQERALVDLFVAAAQADHGCSVLIVEHDMDLVRRLCPRIIVLDGGQVLAEGAPETVLARQDVIDAYMGVVDDADEAA